MEDRVGDVLAQRRALDRSAGLGVAVSVLFHAGITSLAVWAALHQPAPQTASVLNIRFAPMPAARPAVARKSAAPPAPKPLAKPIVEPKPLAEPKPAVEQPKPAAKVEPKTVPFSPFGKSTRKGSEAPPAAPKPAPAPPPAPAATARTSDIAVGGTGVTALEGGDFPYTIYIDRMKTLIGGRWYRPQVGAGPTAVVYFAVERDGTIRDSRVETSSGNGTFDRAALRAVLESSPLPPLPFGYAGNYLGVHLTFK